MTTAKPTEYTVTSDRLRGHDKGDTVTAEDLNGDERVQRLLQSQAIKPKRATQKKEDA